MELNDYIIVKIDADRGTYSKEVRYTAESIYDETLEFHAPVGAYQINDKLTLTVCKDKE